MISTLRKKLVAVSMLSVTLVLFLLIGAANYLSYRSVLRQADGVLQILASNSGHFPDVRPEPAAGGGQAAPTADSSASGTSNSSSANTDPALDNTPGGIASSAASGGQAASQEPPSPPSRDSYLGSPELPYESRYFSVLLGSDGQVLRTETGRIAAVNAEEAQSYAQQVFARGKTNGFYSQYRYLLSKEADGTRVIFLDCSVRLSSIRSFLLASILVSAAGLAAVFVLILVFSRRIIRPIAESYEKQRRFITDAGHEIRTPITIISTDVEVLEMENGQNEWTEDIRRQAERLAGLTNDLIFLSRMDEERPALQQIDLPFSDLVGETAAGFQTLAKAQGKVLSLDIQPLLSVHGEEKSLRQLVSILLDNALKYTPAEETIRLTVRSEGRNIRLTEENTASYPLGRETVRNLFDRFYRADASRSADSGAGGYGIGLSIARAIVTAHRGRISASAEDGNRLRITVTLPAAVLKEE